MAIQAQLYQENLGFPLFGGSSQDLMMMNDQINGCFNNAQQKNHLYHHNQQQQQQMLFHEFHGLNQRNDNVWLNNNSTTTTMVQNSYSQAIFDHLDKTQRQEIDQYIKYQNERLRRMIQEQRKQQLVSLMRKMEPKLMGLLREKEEEISQATKRTMELQELLRTLEEENVTWQRIAQENEAMALSLNSSLEQAMRERASSCAGLNDKNYNTNNNNVVEDEESCCEEEGERKRQSVSRIRVCESCGCRDSCMVFLPCRHFCSCKACESFLDSCPVCRQPKKASIEALTL